MTATRLDGTTYLRCDADGLHVYICPVPCIVIHLRRRSA